MKKYTIAMCVTVVLLVVALTTVCLMASESTKAYKELEGDLIESAMVYIENGNVTLDNDESIKISSKTLLDNGYIDSMTVEKDECTGYVLANKKSDKYSYDAYIKCDKYTTKDYK